MSREWSDDCDNDIPLAMWERALENSINSKRGQAFLKELEAELLAMKARGEGRLINGYFIADGSAVKNFRDELETLPKGCCTIGVMCKKKNVAPEIAKVNKEIEDPWDFHSKLPKELNIARCIVAEIGTINDDSERTTWFYDVDGTLRRNSHQETDEQRFERMLKWVQCHISRNGEWIPREGLRQAVPA